MTCKQFSHHDFHIMGVSERGNMKLIGYVKLLLLICIVVFPAASGADGKVDESPVYLVPEAQFTFEPVVDGAEVVHDFIILNKGAEPLSIINVKTG
jgi:hypothetical protein